MATKEKSKILPMRSRENFSRIQDSFGIKALLDAAHDFNPEAVLLLHELPFSDAYAVFTGCGATFRDCKGNNLIIGPVQAFNKFPVLHVADDIEMQITITGMGGDAGFQAIISRCLDRISHHR